MQEIHDKAAAARETLASLNAKMLDIAARMKAIEAERAGVSLAAATGDSAARDKLAALKAENSELIEQATDLAPAIIQAGHNVEAAEASLSALATRQEAERRAALAERLRAAGIAIEKGLQAFSDGIAELVSITRDPDAAGISFLQPTFTRPHIMNAVHAALTELAPFMDPEDRHPIAPHLRHGFGAVLGGWADRLKGDAQRAIDNADTVIGTKTKRKAA